MKHMLVVVIQCYRDKATRYFTRKRGPVSGPAPKAKKTTRGGGRTGAGRPNQAAADPTRTTEEAASDNVGENIPIQLSDSGVSTSQTNQVQPGDNSISLQPNSHSFNGLSSHNITSTIQTEIQRLVPSIIQAVSSQLAPVLLPAAQASANAAVSPNPMPGAGLVEEDTGDLIHDHIDQLCKPEGDSDSDDDIIFNRMLLPAELDLIQKQKYLDFEKVFRRGQKKGGGGPKLNINYMNESFTITPQAPTSTSEMSFEDWEDIFLSFQSEHCKWFPRDASKLPKYHESLREMKRHNMDWKRYDESFRLSRARKLARNPASRSVLPWSHTDLQLYLSCTPKLTPQAAPTKSPNTQGVNTSGQRKPFSKLPFDLKQGTCWKYQHGSCAGDCKFPDTHTCYKCGKGHPTKNCRPEVNPKVQSSTGREAGGQLGGTAGGQISTPQFQQPGESRQ